MNKQAQPSTSKEPAKGLARLAAAGYSRPEDIALIRPNDYEDLRLPCKLSEAPADKPFLAEVTCEEQKITGRWPRRLMLVKTTDGSANLTIRLHNFNAGLREALAPGKRVRIFGQLTADSKLGALFSSKLEMVHPRFLPLDKPLTSNLTPTYPAIGKLASYALARYINKAAEFVHEHYEQLPKWVRLASSTMPLADSLRMLHHPKPEELDELESTAIHSLKFDEWLAHILLQRHRKLRLKRREALVFKSKPDDIDVFAKQFEFTLTASQKKAMEAVAADLGQPQAMRRLIHGDVGCGKTLVAAFACWLVAREKRRCAIMCPTVILASQHYLRLKPVFENLGLNCVLLLGTMRGGQRKQALETIASDANTVIIGTHALFQDKTELTDLALAVIDEQHRFGVSQRKALERKGGGAHVLMLSATPIPRTLVLGMLSHLDVTRITERPQKGSIRTLVFSAEQADEVLREITDNNLQAYWICPLIKRSAKFDLRAAEEEFERIRRLAPELNTALIHGKMDNASKLEAMEAFQDGTTRLLVATTVVEVGVDAPEADVIVIDHCERLGLSQLHQLRGRVGRGGKTGFCALLYEPGLSAAAQERLHAMRTIDDGFEIAKKDLKQRGPGDIIGKRQSGAPKYRFADLEDGQELLEQANEIAEKLLERDTTAAKSHVQLWCGTTRANRVQLPPG